MSLSRVCAAVGLDIAFDADTGTVLTFIAVVGELYVSLTGVTCVIYNNI